MAMEDIEDLASQGIVLTPREIVRLNSLGVKAEHNADSYSFYALPRCVFFGSDIVLREPTIGHEIWYDMVSRAFNIEDETTDFCLRAFMMSMDSEELPKWDKLKELTNALKDFMSKKLSGYTLRQIMCAVDYCMYGNDDTFGENPPVQVDNSNTEGIDENTSIAVGIIRDTQALSLGIPLKDIYKMTRSSLQQIIQKVYQEKGIDIQKSIKDKVIGEYYCTLDTIKDNHSKEKNKDG